MAIFGRFNERAQRVIAAAQKAAVEIVDGALACDVYDWLMREDWEIAESEEQ